MSDGNDDDVPVGGAAMSDIEIVDHVPTHPALYPDDPVAMVQLATVQANELAAVIEGRKLYAMISGRKHVTVQGWTLLGAMTGVFPITEWSRPIDLEGDRGWEARVVAKHLSSGEIVGAAEGMCLRSESTWTKRDEYALRSMAETRARSKALRGPLEFVMELAGFQTTPAEEMPRDEPSERPPAEPSPSEQQMTQLKEIRSSLAELDEDDERRQEGRRVWKRVTGKAGQYPTSMAKATELLNALGEAEIFVPGEEPFDDVGSPSGDEEDPEPEDLDGGEEDPT